MSGSRSKSKRGSSRGGSSSSHKGEGEHSSGSSRVRKFVSSRGNFGRLVKLLSEDAQGRAQPLPDALMDTIIESSENNGIEMDVEAAEKIMDTVLSLKGAHKYTMRSCSSLLCEVDDALQRTFLRATMPEIIPFCLDKWYDSLLPQQKLAVQGLIISSVGNHLDNDSKYAILSETFSGSMVQNGVDILREEDDNRSW